MGASNALAAYRKYAGRVPPLSLTLLVYMALVSKDSDESPWYGEGHAALAEHALRRPAPVTESDLRAVRRGVSPLLHDDVKAITVDRRGAVRTDGPNTIRYRLNLDLTPDGNRPTSQPVDNAPGDPPHRTKSAGHTGRFPT